MPIPSCSWAILVALFMMFGANAQAQLLHRYDFSTGANDSVGSANGTLYGAATISGGGVVTVNTNGSWTGGAGGAPSQGVKLPVSAVSGITGAFTIEAWFTCTWGGTPWPTLFSFSDATLNNYVLSTPARNESGSGWPSAVAVIGGGGVTSEQIARGPNADQGGLHNLMVTFDGTTVRLYFDGIQFQSFNDAGLNLSTLTRIGINGGSPWPDPSPAGTTYDFRIYGQALTPAQVGAVCGLGKDVSNASISNVLASPPSSGVPFNANLVRLPFYGSPYLHDPGTMVKEGNNYFIYGDGTGIAGITSADLRNWSSATAVFPGGPPSWTTNSIPGGSPNYFWAPDTAYFNGLWHMYYAYSEWATRNSVIGVATSPSLANAVWTDQGKVVKSYYPATADTDTTSYNCIDPSICVATNGTVWMSYGSYSSGILVTQIDPTTGLRMNTNSLGTQVASNGPGGGEGNTEEASCIYQHGGYWYLFVNWGGCCSGTYSTYNIRVGRSFSPTGPFYDKNGVNLNNSGGTMFLESSARYIGPGHPAVMDDNGTNWFTYHFYDGLANGNATVGMNQLYWSADGWPVMTNDWSALYPLATDANESSGTYNASKSGGATFVPDSVRGNVLNLDGASGYVSLPLSVGNASTFAAWVKWNGGAAKQRIFDFGNDTNNYFFLTPAADTGLMRFAITTNGAGGEQGIEAPSALPGNSWHHVAVTLDGFKGVLYLDGAPVATNNSLTIRPWQTLPHNNFLGKSQAGGNYFSGALSSFRIFGRALSASEISDIYLANPTLAHRYSFTTNGPSAVWDSIGMAHGTLMGSAVVTNNALKLTGASGGYANLPGGLVSGSSSVTLEFWATFGVNSNYARVFDTGNINGSFGDHYFFYSPHTGANPNGQRMELSTSSTKTLNISSTLDNRTVHVACICDPANSYLAVYTNGVLEAQLITSTPALTGVANAWSFIGRSLFSSDAYLNGTIDELRLYDGRLTPQQIAANDIAGPGVLQVPSVTATNLAFIKNGSVLTLFWPADHLGWRLQVQTNNLTMGLNTNWFDVIGSAATNRVIQQMDLINGSVFYRLVYP